ncbi:MAG: YaaC family protein [Hyphomicrobiaceae bacterium]
MNNETWQKLLSLESRDIVAMRFKAIHGRELNARRAKEITAAAKQAREFFRNAHIANTSVKPLLTFYGVASLARAMTLLLKRDGGEECLTKGHGIETVDWSKQLSGELSVGIEAVSGLKIRTCSGLFADFAKETKNRLSMHVRSGAVDWRLNYRQPTLGDEIHLEDLLARLPDLRNEHAVIATVPKYVTINEMLFDITKGVNIKIPTKAFEVFKSDYAAVGYNMQDAGELTIMTGSPDLMNEHTPQFAHTYVHKMFGAIPNLFLVAPMPTGNRYSQLCITYMVGYVLGMLARYFPTHWVALAQGEKGDALWPTLNQAHRIVEETFPELVAEMIEDILANPQ